MPAGFTITLGTVELPAPGPATVTGPLPSHVQAVSENHVVYAHRLTDRDVWLYTLTLENVTQDQYRSLQAFHGANGTRYEWNYAASDGTAVLNCRFSDAVLNWQRESSELWSLQVRFQGGPLFTPE